MKEGREPTDLQMDGDKRKRIKEIELRLNTMYFQNGQDLEQGGLGDGNDEEIARLKAEKKALYTQLGELSPESQQAERNRLMNIVVARTLAEESRSGGFGFGSEE